MSNFKLPYFGQLDPMNLEEYYDTDVDLNGEEVQIDLNFDHKSIAEVRLEAVKQFLGQLKEFMKKNEQYIQQDYANEHTGTVRDYITHLIKNVSAEDLEDVIEPDDTETSQEQQLIDALQLVRIGLYPDDLEKFAVFDYTVSRDLTDYLIVVTTNQHGELHYIVKES